jgi:hypothetical protein
MMSFLIKIHKLLVPTGKPHCAASSSATYHHTNVVTIENNFPFLKVFMLGLCHLHVSVQLSYNLKFLFSPISASVMLILLEA